MDSSGESGDKGDAIILWMDEKTISGQHPPPGGGMTSVPHPGSPLALLIGRGGDANRHGAFRGEFCKKSAWRMGSSFPRHLPVISPDCPLEYEVRQVPRNNSHQTKTLNSSCMFGKAVVIFRGAKCTSSRRGAVVARQAHNLEVVGSNPAAATSYNPWSYDRGLFFSYTLRTRPIALSSRTAHPDSRMFS